MNSFFDNSCQIPKSSRRHFLKSAAGASALVSLPALSLSQKDKTSLAALVKTDPWLTLDATLMHLLPVSQNNPSSGPSAKDINALAYLHQVITVQPTSQAEKDFIVKGVGWLNGYSQSELDKPFVELSVEQKEVILLGISTSRAGENWLSTLLNYLFEAMLSPPSYGGNTNGKGWQWLEHQGGFPLPDVGQRYFELPPRARSNNEIPVSENNSAKVSTHKPSLNLAKAQQIKSRNKA